jgi:opacity protein-like surface antigen
MKKILPITAIVVFFSQISFAETTRTIYTSPIFYNTHPSNVVSHDLDAVTTKKTTIPTKTIAKATRIIYTSPTFYNTHPSNVVSHDLDAVTTTKTTIPTETITETKIKKVAKVEASNLESKTEGSYAGLDLFGTKTTLIVKNTYLPEYCSEYQTEIEKDHETNGCTYYEKPALTNNSYGLGLTYKYAFNFNKFFIAPGIFFEQNNHRAVNGNNRALTRLQIKNRYGIRTDFGYDIKRFAPYLTIGYAEVSYRSRGDGFDMDSNRVSSVKNGVNGNVFYGAGLKFNLTSSLSLNTEYNFQKVTLKTNLHPSIQNYLLKTDFLTRMDTVKTGLYYKF